MENEPIDTGVWLEEALYDMTSWLPISSSKIARTQEMKMKMVPLPYINTVCIYIYLYCMYEYTMYIYMYTSKGELGLKLPSKHSSSTNPSSFNTLNTMQSGHWSWHGEHSQTSRLRGPWGFDISLQILQIAFFPMKGNWDCRDTLSTELRGWEEG